jgi:HlyD family secretion protein
LRRLLLVLLVPLAAVAWWAYQRRTDAPDVPFARVSRETLVSSLQTNGKVEPIEWESLRADVASLVQKVMVHEGQAVAPGTPVAQLGGASLGSDLAAAEARAAQARGELAVVERGGKSSELAEIENTLARARLDRETAQRDLVTLERLSQRQAATKSEVDAARNKVQQLDVDIEGLQRRRGALVGQNDRAVAEARVKEADAAVSLARTRIGQSVIRSSLGGIVYSLPVRPGSFVNPGDLIANVGRLDTVRVRVYVDEPELGRVSAGQPVSISWDALPGKKWTGTVERLPSEIVALGTRQVGEVLCTIGNPGRELVPGTNVNAEIRSRIARDALTIPKEALRRDAKGPGVWALRGEQIAWQPVETGVSSVTRTQVTSGLKEGDAVALPTEEALRAGQKVRPVFPEVPRA